MKKNIRELINDKLLSLIPSDIKPADYISEILDISKEAAYRRLSGKMSFYVEELMCLSEHLGFSIDELTAKKYNNGKALIDLKIQEDPCMFFNERIKNFRTFLDKELSAPSSELIIALNYLPVEFCVHYENLFKLSYYLWIHWKDKKSNGLKYSEVNISQEQEELRKSIDADIQNLKNITFILDPNVFLTPLNLVIYYNKLGLINNEEKKAIKANFHEMIDTVEIRLRTMNTGMRQKNDYYLANFNIDVNSCYCQGKSSVSSSFLLYFFNRIIVTAPKICAAHKEWLQSLMKYSILISGSNETDQAEYLKNQRVYIDSL